MSRSPSILGSELSAGQRVRLALARLLLEDHDLVLLDEPTNHLDVPAREWLEGHLAGMDAAYVVASHDRRFLDAVSSKVAHLDRGYSSSPTTATSCTRSQPGPWHSGSREIGSGRMWIVRVHGSVVWMCCGVRIT